MEENTETTLAAEDEGTRATAMALRSEGFPQELGMRDLTSLLLLFILFFTCVNDVQLAGPAALLYWVLGLFFLIPMAVVIRWLSRWLSFYGGHYIWIKQIVGGRLAELTGVCTWLFGIAIIVTTLQAALLLLPAWFRSPLVSYGGEMCLLFVATMLALIPLHSLKHLLFAAAGLPVTTFLLVGLAGGWWLMHGHAPAIDPHVWQNWHAWLPSPRNIGIFGIVSWALMGIDWPFIMGNEVRGDKTKRQRAGRFLWWGSACILLAYLAATFGVMVVVPPEKATSVTAMVIATRTVWGPICSNIVLVLLILNQIATSVVIQLISSRLLIAMAQDRLLPFALTRLSRHHVPLLGMMTQALCCTLLFTVMTFLLPPLGVLPLSEPVNLVLQALESLVWSIATLILFGSAIWMLTTKRSPAWRKIVLHGPPGRWSTLLALGMTLLGFVVTLVSSVLVLATSWASRWLSTSQWSIALVASTGSLVGIGWLCTEVSHQGRLVHDLSQEIRRNNVLRAQVTQAYMHRQHLVQRQQELLQERDRLYREQVARAERDVLTGLCNHRTLMSALEHLLTRCREEGASCAVLFLDLDHFKQINDTWGHRAGDALLHQLGKSIQQYMAELDVNHLAGRYGGEEFMVLLYGVDTQETTHIADQLRAYIEQEVLVWRDEHLSSPISVHVTASIGVAVYPIHATRYQDLIHRGDQAMYKAKQQGGNRVCVAGTQEQWATSGEGQTEGLASMETMTEQALLALLQARDSQAYTHGQRMAELTEAVAKRMERPPKEVEMVRLAALLHDLGKVGISEELLSKTGPLTAEEQDTLKTHPTIGHAILVQAGGIFSLLAPIVAAHHECWDGSGYPRGLQRESIPFLARIVAVVDAFDEMVIPDEDREARGEEDACAQLIQGAGTQFDPDVVQAFLEVWSLRQQQRHRLSRWRAPMEQE